MAARTRRGHRGCVTSLTLAASATRRCNIDDDDEDDDEKRKGRFDESRSPHGVIHSLVGRRQVEGKRRGGMSEGRTAG